VKNALSFELHIPGYQFYGPGTHLEKRLARGDQSINPGRGVTRHCVFSRITTSPRDTRRIGYSARKRITAKDSTLGEKVAAIAVWTAMKAKTKIGMGMKTKMKTKKRRRKNEYFRRETWRYIANFTDVGCARIFDR